MIRSPKAQDKLNKKQWKAQCILTVIPLTAILHHLVFYRFSCMLNAFGPEYNLVTIHSWLAKDPSLGVAVGVMILLYYIGKYLYWLRILVKPVFLSFLPLSLWIWDIPFTGRFICHHFHDARVILPIAGMPLSSRFFYIFGAIIYIPLVTYLIRKQGPHKRNLP